MSSLLADLEDADGQSRLTALAAFKTTFEAADSQAALVLQQDAFPHLLRVLKETEVSLSSLSIENQVRASALETIQRFTFSEAFKAALPNLLRTILEILQSDNEENACIVLKMFIDIHKAYKTGLEDFVQPFLDIVLKTYQNMPAAVRESFDSVPSASGTSRLIQPTTSDTPMSPSASNDAIENTHPPDKLLSRSTKSFKVLTELPIIIVLLFSSNRQIVQTNLVQFTSVIVEMLSLQPPASNESQKSATISSPIRRQMFADLMLAQIKTLSFLAYVLRGYTAYMKKYAESIPQFVLRLLRDCPSEMSAARKELLVATRHILSTEFRNSFVNHIEVLLDEKLLVGIGVTARETLRSALTHNVKLMANDFRPLAYSMLADLIHHVRAELNYRQIRKTVIIYSASLMDASLSSSIQTMSVKLLLNMIDRIMKLPSQSDGRQIMMLILSCFTRKLAALNARNKTGSQAVHDQKKLMRAQGLHIGTSFGESDLDGLKDAKALFKNLMIGLKTVLFGLKSCNPAPTSTTINAQQWGEAVRGLAAADLDVFTRLFEQGSMGFSFYRTESPAERGKAMEKRSFDGPIILLTPNSREEKDILETFATVFTHLDPAAFQEILNASLVRFYDQVMQNAILLHIPQFFLTNDATSPSFAGLLLQFLVDKLPELGSADTLKSSVLLRLFKMCFNAVTMFPDLNEAILQPHLANIIILSMKLSAKSNNPTTYYVLMRALFRSIGGGRFELLYKEVLPLLQVLLECLNTLLQAARKQQEKELFVELCLTVPVRLSVLLPYLSYLMKPLVIALTAGPELVTQGLRTLELCIDNLTQEFLDPILTPIMPELMQALWSHLKPLPHNHHHSHSALRILGKMGGRNRRFIDDSQLYISCENPEDLAAVKISFHGSEERVDFKFTKFLPFAVRVVQDTKVDAIYKEKAFSLLADSVRFFITSQALSPEDGISLRAIAREIINGIPASSSAIQDSLTNEDDVTMEDASTKPKLIDRLRIQEKSLKEILTGIYSCASIPTLMSKTHQLVISLTRHFTIVHLIEAHRDQTAKCQPFSIKSSSTDFQLSTSVFFDVVVDILASGVQEEKALAQESILEIYRTCDAILGLEGEAHALPIFATLVARLCHCCFEEAYRKSAGVLGLSVLIEKLDLPCKWFQAHQIDMVKALLYVVKDIMPEVPGSCTVDAICLLKKVVTKSHEPATLSPNPLVPLLVVELANPNGKVRDTAQDLFRCMSNLTSTPIQTIIKPAQERLLTPIFGKPLRALPFAMQIGHIDAITYCLSLSPTFLEFNDELMRLLHEALALADAEDDALVSVNRTSQYKSSSALVNLRIVCIKLLTIAVSSPEFGSPSQLSSRSRIIAVFFKSLYSKSADVVEVANKGLKQVLSQNQKLPKDLLQAGLRPILMNLSDHKKLTVPGLEGLARLLELLTNYFKVEIGKKLLDHLRAWSDPATLQHISGKPLREQQSIKVIAAILNIFHLLPPSAHMFMDELVVAVCGLEDKLRRTKSSPLRASLLRFINRYPTESWEYLQTKIKDASITRFLLQLADDDCSLPFRSVLKDARGKLLDDLMVEKTNLNLTIAVNLFAIVSKHDAKATPDRDQLRQLIEFYKFVVSAETAVSGHELDQIGALLIEVSILYMQMCPSDIDSLFALIEAQSEYALPMSDELEEYVMQNIVLHGRLELRREFLIMAMNIFGEVDKSQAYKIALFGRIINPILLADDYHHSESSARLTLIDKVVVDLIHSRVWKVALADFGNDVICASDLLRVELLQMSTILLQKHTTFVSEVRKDVIKFAWNYIKLDDVITKNSAYVFICCFVAAYEIPAKMAAQIYFALLKTTQPEARLLVKQALDVLAPVLTKRIPAGPDPKSPNWTKYPRRVIAEESNPLLLIPVYQFVTRHPSLFDTCREQVVPQILISLPKLAFPSNTNLESRTTAVDLVELLLAWAEDDNDGEETIARSPAIQASKVALLEQLFNFIFRFVCVPVDSTRKELNARCMKLLGGLMRLSCKWDTAVPMSVLEPYLVDDKSPSSMMNALEALSTITSEQAHTTVYSSLKTLVGWLERPLKSDNIGVQTALQPVLCNALACSPVTSDIEEQPEDDGSELRSRIISILQENLQSNNNLQCSLLILESLAQHSEASLDILVPPLMKTFNNLIKDHIGSRANGATAGSVSIIDNTSISNALHTAEADLNIEAILSLMNIMCKRMMHLGEQRRVFLAAMAQLIDKSSNSKLCSHILKLVSEQVLEKRETFPTIKEKVSLLLKMTSFESRGDENLIKQYLKLIIAIYKDPAIARTELTVRLEQAFLMGTRAHDFEIRTEFMKIFNSSMSRSSYTRLNYIFGVQNWESLSSHYWIHQAGHLLLGSIAGDQPLALSSEVYTFAAMSVTTSFDDTHMEDDRLDKLVAAHNTFLTTNTHTETLSMFDSLGQLEHLDVNCSELLWSELFPLVWGSLHKKDRQEIAKAITVQLSKEFHLRQVDRRPNVVHTLLLGVSRCEPLISLPPHLVKYLGKTFDSWYIALDLLEKSSSLSRIEEPFTSRQESTLDALTEMYASLSEDDMFYGLWRSRCRYLETNAAISYEQNGMWDKAQQLYEQAQVKARSGTVPFSEPEYTLWEDHWILCAQKLQQWDVLTDLAKQEGYSDLLLECAWRISDWTSDREPLDASIRSLMDVPTPRRYTFEAFMTLQKTQAKAESLQEYQRICDEGMQLSLRKWHQLPSSICQAHIPLLQAFQQHVELQEASQIYGSLASTQASNLEAKSHELKHILQTWRERLPNFYDDINAWSDLVAWRGLVFATINRVYLPLVPAIQQSAAPSTNSSATSFAYRGYHETAWIINRFAHVARKHQLPDVCINQLSKIYTLPNIEIQEAFLKLREQATCHYQNTSELTRGLEVISNTNLMYFAKQQQAEFFTLKGMFLAKLKLNEDANQAFAAAIQIDLTLPKAWAEWGQYSDRLFQEDSTQLNRAGNAISCYLQAAGLYKNGRARNMLSRILWLLSLDDSDGTIATAFDTYKGEVCTWYWITFIPQLLTSLSHKEARHARQVLIKIAKSFPQSLHFQLRTTKEDYAVIKKQALAAAQTASVNNKPMTESVSNADTSQHKPPQNDKPVNSPNPAPNTSGASPAAPAVNGDSATPQSPHAQSSLQNRQPWEHVDEIMAILKTAYPLLALSMETVVDQIQQRFKCHADEDAYRLIVALLNDGVQYIGRLVSVTAETKLPPATQANVTRFAESVLPKNIKTAFEREFVQAKPNLQDYVAKLRRWRDKFEVIFDRRSQTQQLEQVSSWLSEFQYQKFDEVEVPGQYLQHRDSNADFIRIDRFMPTLDVVRGNGICYRRMTMRGHDGSLHQFAIQYPAARHCRREERIIQLFRILSGVLARRKESRKRNLSFNLPAAVPLAPHIRIVQDDSSYISLQGIYEDYCAREGQHKDDPLRLATNKIQDAPSIMGNRQALIDLKVDILNVIQKTLVPETIVLDFFKQNYISFAEFWRFRKHFTQQYASLTFMTYIMNINNRFPHKLFISRKTGHVWGTEILPGMAPNNPVFQNSESVPFRFTPTLQTLIGQISVEGVFSSSLMAIARCLTEGELELDQHLSVFVRDELITWFTQQHRPVTQETQLPEKVASNVAQIVKRASSLSQTASGTNLPAYQTIIDLISMAVNPRNLAQMDQLWSSFL